MKVSGKFLTLTIVVGTLTLLFLANCAQKSNVGGAFNSSSTNGSSSVPGTTLASCTYDNQIIPNAGTVIGYVTSSVAFGQTCTPETVTCSNGDLVPSNSFATCTVSTNPAPTPTPASCSFNGSTIASGSSVTAYLALTVPAGQTCTNQAPVAGAEQVDSKATDDTDHRPEKAHG